VKGESKAQDRRPGRRSSSMRPPAATIRERWSRGQLSTCGTHASADRRRIRWFGPASA
jgi:hypothetical protein